jgi:hypothetical protein
MVHQPPTPAARLVTENAALFGDFGRPPAACVFVSRHLLRHLTVLLEKQSKQPVNESSVLFDGGLLATFVEWRRLHSPLCESCIDVEILGAEYDGVQDSCTLPSVNAAPLMRS